MPRPTKLTPALQHAICQAVALGMAPERAGCLVGIDRSTVSKWVCRGRAALQAGRGGWYVEFFVAIEKAKHADELRRLARIEAAGKGGMVTYEKITTYPDGRSVREVRRAPPEWQADAWHLERTRPEQYGRRERFDMRVLIQQTATRIAGELGIEVEALLAEATLLLQEGVTGES